MWSILEPADEALLYLLLKIILGCTFSCLIPMTMWSLRRDPWSRGASNAMQQPRRHAPTCPPHRRAACASSPLTSYTTRASPGLIVRTLATAPGLHITRTVWTPPSAHSLDSHARRRLSHASRAPPDTPILCPTTTTPLPAAHGMLLV